MEEWQDKQKSYLSFKLGKETFASNVSNVLSISEMATITGVPKTPDYFEGVMNLRGNALPVINTRLKLGMKKAEATTETCVLVLEIETNNKTTMVGAIVDSVDEVLKFEKEMIKPIPNTVAKNNTDYLTGMVQKDEGFIMVLNTNKVFKTGEVIALKAMQ